MKENKKIKNKKGSDVKCKNCGSYMQFNPEFQELECLHCGSKLAFENKKKPKKKDFALVEQEFQSWDKESALVKCANCGAKEVVSSKNIAHKCSFCGSSKITSTNSLPGLKPSAVLPFNVTQKKATVNFMKWLKQKWFTPSDLKKTARINDFNGIYTPTWSYDTKAHTKYKGILERVETRRRGERTETVHIPIPVKGQRDDNFKDVLVPVGQKIDRVSFKTLEPFNFTTLKVYDTNYLAGFAANHYSVNANEAWKSAKRMMESEIKWRIIRNHHADRARYLNTDINYTQTMYSYMLLPIWVCNYTYKQNLYNFFINGNTGKVTGKVPRSAFKIIRFILFIVLIFVLITVLVRAK